MMQSVVGALASTFIIPQILIVVDAELSLQPGAYSSVSTGHAGWNYGSCFSVSGSSNLGNLCLLCPLLNSGFFDVGMKT